MAEIQIKCPLCFGVMKIRTEWSGMQIKCPLCQRVICVPQLQTPAVPPPQPIPETITDNCKRYEEEIPQQHYRKKNTSACRNIILTIAGIALVGVLCWWFCQPSAERLYNQGLEFYKNNNFPKAVECYTKAAEQGYAEAQFNLGVMYDDGQGVAQNYAEAAKWFTKAAEQGYADAQYLLGEMYISGQGVKANDEKAIQWLRKAAKQGHAKAQKRLKDAGIEY